MLVAAARRRAVERGGEAQGVFQEVLRLGDHEDLAGLLVDLDGRVHLVEVPELPEVGCEVGRTLIRERDRVERLAPAPCRPSAGDRAWSIWRYSFVSGTWLISPMGLCGLPESGRAETRPRPRKGREATHRTAPFNSVFAARFPRRRRRSCPPQGALWSPQRLASVRARTFGLITRAAPPFVAADPAPPPPPFIRFMTRVPVRAVRPLCGRGRGR